MLSDFHTHSTFSDGKNTPEEMVRRAIAAGAEALGISDHAWVDYDGYYCMAEEKVPAYFRELARLKEAYGSQITLFCGMEADLDSARIYEDCDYVVGSVHYVRGISREFCVDDSPETTLRCVKKHFGGDFNSYAEAYFSRVAQLPEKTGANIIGHFDVLTKFACRGAAPDWEHPRFQGAWKAALRTLAGKAALEINTGAMIKGCRREPYPREDMLRFWHELGGEIVFSSDAHNAPALFGYFDEAGRLARRCGFTRVCFRLRDGRTFCRSILPEEGGRKE